MVRPPRAPAGSTSSTPEGSPASTPRKSKTPPLQGDLSPELLSAYEQALPGSGWILLQMTNRVAEARISDRRLGKVFALIAFLSVVIAAIGALALGSPATAIAFVSAGVVSAITGAFISS